jgi:hypothetical protein
LRHPQREGLLLVGDVGEGAKVNVLRRRTWYYGQRGMLASSNLGIMTKSNVWAWFGYRSLIMSRFMLLFQAHFRLHCRHSESPCSLSKFAVHSQARIVGFEQQAKLGFCDS